MRYNGRALCLSITYPKILLGFVLTTRLVNLLCQLLHCGPVGTVRKTPTNQPRQAWSLGATETASDIHVTDSSWRIQ